MTRDKGNHNDLLLDIGVLYRSTQKYYDKMLTTLSLTYAQLPILILIYENEGISQQQIAIEGGYDKGTITKQVQKLADSGWIRVRASQKDKRAKELYTTEKARQQMSRVYAIRASWWKHIRSSLPDEDVDRFSSFYKNMAASARDYAQADFNEIVFFDHHKISLESFPGHLSTVVFTGGCNFRCPFCKRSRLVFLKEDSDTVSESGILNYLSSRKGILDAVVVSGAEPLMHPEIDSFLKKVKEMGFKVKLETNGSYFEHLKTIVEQNLVDAVEMLLMNTPEKYGMTIGMPDFDLCDIRKSVRYLCSLSIPVTFSCMPVKEFHEKADLMEMAGLIQGASEFVLKVFDPDHETIQEGLHGYTVQELEEIRKEIQNVFSNTRVQ